MKPVESQFTSLKMTEVKSSSTVTTSATTTGKVYSEVSANSDLDRVDVLVQFKANLAQVEDLGARLHFMVSEVRGLIRR